MKGLLERVRACDRCAGNLPLGPKPVLSAHPDAAIAIIGQAPGIKVHRSGIPWNDQSGKELRHWLGIGEAAFYDPRKIAIIPMGFCYPGKGRSGDLPPRPECAPLWHPKLMDRLKQLRLVILVGWYAQAYYLKEKRKSNLTETVRAFEDYLPGYFPLPHPSPRNRFWLSKNPWFKKDVLPALQNTVGELLL